MPAFAIASNAPSSSVSERTGSGRRRSCRRGHLVADNGLANGGKRNAGELQMLNPEWNSDDGEKAPEGPERMPDRQPDSGETNHMTLPNVPNALVPMSSVCLSSLRLMACLPKGKK